MQISSPAYLELTLSHYSLPLKRFMAKFNYLIDFLHLIDPKKSNDSHSFASFVF